MGKKNVKNGRISVRVTAELEREFEKICKERNLTKSETVRFLVEDYIRRFENTGQE